MEEILKEKKLLIVDDEQDILETLEELLDMCIIDSAPDFEAAKKFLGKENYDAAILDIMGVKGYDLLQITTQKGIPTLMLTAHALSPNNLVKSIKEGAYCYLPKDKITDIVTYLADMLKDHDKNTAKQGKWFSRLKPFFDKKFGTGWRDEHKEFWTDFDKTYRVSKEEVEKIM